MSDPARSWYQAALCYRGIVFIVAPSCKIRGDNIIREIELLHMKVYEKHVLYVQRYILEITIKSKMINVW